MEGRLGVWERFVRACRKIMQYGSAGLCGLRCFGQRERWFDARARPLRDELGYHVIYFGGLC